MQKVIFNKNSSAEIIEFENMQECAKLTLPYISKGNCAISGGSTFAALFKEWTKFGTSFSESQFFPVDERVVPFTDPASNWGFAYNNFLKIIGHENDKNNFAESYLLYSKILKSTFGSNIPVFDSVLLGTGDDGHTASLFPNGSYLNDMNSVLLKTKSPKVPANRISLAPATIINAKKLVTVISGENKKDIVQKIFNRDISLPIVKILSIKESSILLIDKKLL